LKIKLLIRTEVGFREFDSFEETVEYLRSINKVETKYLYLYVSSAEYDEDILEHSLEDYVTSEYDSLQQYIFNKIDLARMNAFKEDEKAKWLFLQEIWERHEESL
jgi:hypothetical protein